MLATWTDMPRDQRVHASGTVLARSATLEQRALLAAFNFAGRCVLKVREHGPIITDEQRENVPVDVMFARACCSLARATSATPCRASPTTTADCSPRAPRGSTPEREALAAALKARKVRSSAGPRARPAESRR